MFFNPLHWLADKLAGRSADAVVDFINSTPGKHSGGWVEFRYARSALRDGDFKEAESLTRGELAKEPQNYEGLMLLASIYAQMGRHDQAILTLDELLKSPALIEGQIAVAVQTRQGYLTLMKG